MVFLQYIKLYIPFLEWGCCRSIVCAGISNLFLLQNLRTFVPWRWRLGHFSFDQRSKMKNIVSLFTLQNYFYEITRTREKITRFQFNCNKIQIIWPTLFFRSRLKNPAIDFLVPTGEPFFHLGISKSELFNF